MADCKDFCAWACEWACLKSVLINVQFKKPSLKSVLINIQYMKSNLYTFTLRAGSLFPEGACYKEMHWAGLDMWRHHAQRWEIQLCILFDICWYDSRPVWVQLLINWSCLYIYYIMRSLLCVYPVCWVDCLGIFAGVYRPDWVMLQDSKALCDLFVGSVLLVRKVF